MSTHKRFWDDPYQTHLETQVATVDGDTVSLAETIFYAFSGGQESDAGQIGGHPVLEARKEGFDILYCLPSGHNLRAGDPVSVDIEWPRRLALMRLHFAAELILELVCRKFPGIEKLGAHIASGKARIDFKAPEVLTPHLPALQADAMAIIDADREIRCAFSDKALQRRYWEIDGFARVPCGGTHLRRTGEVGRIALKRKNVGKGVERIEISLDDPR